MCPSLLHTPGPAELKVEYFKLFSRSKETVSSVKGKVCGPEVRTSVKHHTSTEIFKVWAVDRWQTPPCLTQDHLKMVKWGCTLEPLSEYTEPITWNSDLLWIQTVFEETQKYSNLSSALWPIKSTVMAPSCEKAWEATAAHTDGEEVEWQSLWRAKTHQWNLDTSQMKQTSFQQHVQSSCEIKLMVMNVIQSPQQRTGNILQSPLVSLFVELKLKNISGPELHFRMTNKKTKWQIRKHIGEKRNSK